MSVEAAVIGFLWGVGVTMAKPRWSFWKQMAVILPGAMVTVLLLRMLGEVLA